MPTPLDVEKQKFTFGDSWTVAFKYDDSRFYRGGPERLKGELEERSNNESKIVPQATRAVDVIGLHQEDGLLLLEAKDFRGLQGTPHREQGSAATADHSRSRLENERYRCWAAWCCPECRDGVPLGRACSSNARWQNGNRRSVD